mgnify:FL=1
MKKITIREIIKATGAQMIALGDMEEALNKEIWYVTQDSRETKEGVLFVARVGEVRDGHDFLPQCFANGVTACLSQKVVAPTNGAIVLLVPDTGKALLDLAAYYRNLFDIPVVAVTGSVGKTTTKDMIASVVSQKYDTLWTQGNYNNEVGVPLTIFRKEIKSTFIKSFLHYVPFAVLGAMTIPDVLYSTGDMRTAAVGLVVAVFLAWKGKSLLTVALAACAAVLAAQGVLLLF